MEEHFTIEEVAIALETSSKTILRRLLDGELKGVKIGKAWAIPKSSLKKWICDAIGNSAPDKTYEKVEQNGIIVEQNRGQTSCVSGYRYRGTLDPSVTGEAISPRCAAVSLQKSFRFHARRFAPKDSAMRDDLVQEMSLAVLKCRESATRSYFMKRARSRALNYLKREKLRGMAPMSDLKRHPMAPEPLKDAGLCRLLADVGISVAAISNSIGIQIDPDVELDRHWIKERLGLGRRERKNGSTIEQLPERSGEAWWVKRRNEGA